MIDHLVLATDDLERTVADIAQQWRITPTPGGAHVGRGTRNELVALGDGAYLEIIGPDLAQTDHAGPRPFGVDSIVGRQLVGWCARPTVALDRAVAAARDAGFDLGDVASMSRRRPDGLLLEWQLTVQHTGSSAGAVPFLIDWLQSPHPAASLTQPVTLQRLQLTSPDAAGLTEVLRALVHDDRLVVEIGDDGIVAAIQTPAGPVTLAG